MNGEPYAANEAQKIAKHYDAQGILMGNIDAYSSAMTLNAFATVKLIDAKSGQIIAAAHEPSGLLLAYSEQQCAIAAVENVAKHINEILRDLSKKNVAPTPTSIPSQPKKNTPKEVGI